MNDNSFIKLTDIADVISGYAFDSKWFGQGKKKIVRITDLVDGKLALDNAATFDHFAHIVSDQYVVKNQDVLIALSGATTGKIGIVASKDEGVYVNQRIAIVRGKTAEAKSWLPFLLMSDIAKKLVLTAGGAAQPNLSINDLKALPVPNLSLDQQRQIAARLKAQLAQVETACKALEIQEADLAILETRSISSIFAKSKPVKFVKIGDVAVTTSGSTPSRDKKEYWESGQYSWVKTGEVVYKPICETEESISEKALQECSLTLLPPKTVLIAMYGQGKTRGQSAILEVPATTNQACFAILPNGTFHPEYLQYWLRHSYSNLRSLSDSRGGNQANLNGALLKEFTVPLLPIDKQVQIANSIKAILDELEKTKAGIQATKKEIVLIPSRLLAQAFTSIT